MKLFDAHCHLYLQQYDADREAVFERMQEAQMGALVVGTDYSQSMQALELAKQHEFLWASVGLHPNDNIAEQFDVAKYRELAQNPKVVAIGECGLDYFRAGGTEEEREAQKQRFVLQADLSLELGKPLIIHCRNAHDDMLEILESYAKEYGEKLRAIIHFFTGTAELAQHYLDLGCYLSFPGPITYTDMYDESVRTTPLDKILVETDSPFAAPVPHRGTRNEPAYVREVLNKVAHLKGVSAEEAARQVVFNAQKVFGL